MGDAPSKTREQDVLDSRADGPERQAELSLLRQRCVPKPLAHGYESYAPVPGIAAAPVAAYPTGPYEDSSTLVAPSQGIPNLYDTSRTLSTVSQRPPYPQQGGIPHAQGPSQVPPQVRAMPRSDSMYAPVAVAARAPSASPVVTTARSFHVPQKADPTSPATTAAALTSRSSVAVASPMPAEQVDVRSVSQRPSQRGMPGPQFAQQVDKLMSSQMHLAEQLDSLMSPQRQPPRSRSHMARAGSSYAHVQPISESYMAGGGFPGSYVAGAPGSFVAAPPSRAMVQIGEIAQLDAPVSPRESLMPRSDAWKGLMNLPPQGSSLRAPSVAMDSSLPGPMVVLQSPLPQGGSTLAPVGSSMLPRSESMYQTRGLAAARSESFHRSESFRRSESMRRTGSQNPRPALISSSALGLTPIDSAPTLVPMMALPQSDSMYQSRDEVNAMQVAVPRSNSMYRTRSTQIPYTEQIPSVDALQLGPRQPQPPLMRELADSSQAAPFTIVPVLSADGSLQAAISGKSEGARITSARGARTRPEGQVPAWVEIAEANQRALMAPTSMRQGRIGSLRAPRGDNEITHQMPLPHVMTLASGPSNATRSEQNRGISPRDSKRVTRPRTPREKQEPPIRKERDVYERLQESQKQLLKLRDAQKQALARCAAQCNSLMMAAESATMSSEGAIGS